MTTGPPSRPPKPASRPPRLERRYRVRRAAVVAALVAFVTALIVLGQFTFRAYTGATCRATAGGQSFAFTPEQARNAATITGIAMKRGLPARAATIALATALQESNLRNLRYGDRDSLGLFQQRPSQGWGTQAQVLDPVYAANAFYDALVKIDGYTTMEITVVAQKVQRSAYPEAYADHEGQGRVLASALSGHSPGGLGCRLNQSPVGVAADRLTAALLTETGQTGSAADDGRTVTIHTSGEQSAWGVAEWLVASADTFGITQVDVADRSWRRARGRDALDWVRTDGPTAGTTVTVVLVGR